MKTLVISALVSLFLVGCGGESLTKPSSNGVLDAKGNRVMGRVDGKTDQVLDRGVDKVFNKIFDKF